MQTPAVLPSAPSAASSGSNGAPVFNPWPVFPSEDIEAVSRLLASGKVNYWTGNECKQFEKEYAQAIGVSRAVSLSNGTLALELALYALGIGPGDEVIVTPRSFIASASSVVIRGATPVFADVDRDSQNLTAETIAPVITPRTKAIIVVHLAGWPCDMDPILDLARAHGLSVIEDCAQAHGSTYKGRHVGSMGHINAFSFCNDKIITTGGEGGLVTTNDDDLWRRSWSYKDHGKDYDAVHEIPSTPGYRFLHYDFGSNWRMLEFQGVLGRRQLANLSSSVEQRRRNAAILSDAFRQVSALRVTDPPDHTYHSYYKYYVFVRPEALRAGWSKDRLLGVIRGAGVPCFSYYGEMYLEKAFAKHGLVPPERMPVARELSETALVFLVHPTLSQESVYYAAETAARLISEATR